MLAGAPTRRRLWRRRPALRPDIDDLIPWIRTPTLSPRTVAVVAGKGGLGKSTITALLGLVLADVRADRVAAVDLDPGLGTLGTRLGVVTSGSISELAVYGGSRPHADRTDLDRFIGRAGRLEVVPGEVNPHQLRPVSAAEASQVCALLRRFNHVLLADTGGCVDTELLAAAQPTHLVIVGTATLDRAGRAVDALARLEAAQFTVTGANTTIVLSRVDADTPISLSELRKPFDARGLRVVQLPVDPHLTEGGPISWDSLLPATRAGIFALAAEVAAVFNHPDMR